METLDHTALDIFSSIAMQIVETKSGRPVDQPLIYGELVPRELAKVGDIYSRRLIFSMVSCQATRSESVGFIPRDARLL